MDRKKPIVIRKRGFMITTAKPEKYIVGLYERLSNEKIEVGNGEVIVTIEDERESGSIQTQKAFLKSFCLDNNKRLCRDERNNKNIVVSLVDRIEILQDKEITI